MNNKLDELKIRALKRKKEFGGKVPSKEAVMVYNKNFSDLEKVIIEYIKLKQKEVI